MPTLTERMNQMLCGETPPPPIAELVGFQLTNVEPGRSVILFEAGRRHHNPLGTVHGGILGAVADAAMGVAYASTLGEGETFTTVEMKINFLKPVRSGALTVTGRVVKSGRTLGLTECEIVDETGSLVAHATSTCMTLRGAAAVGR